MVEKSTSSQFNIRKDDRSEINHLRFADQFEKMGIFMDSPFNGEMTDEGLQSMSEKPNRLRGLSKVIFTNPKNVFAWNKKQINGYVPKNSKIL